MKFSEDTTLAVEAAHLAGEIIREGFGHARQIRDKGNGNSIVTEVDEKAEQIIINTLQAKTDYSILGEESGEIDGSPEAKWIIDPLDGTTNFTRGVSLLCVSIALMRDDEPVIGVIYNPIHDITYVAEKGKGAWRNGEKMGTSKSMIPPVILLEVGYGGEFRNLFGEVVEKVVGVYSIRKLGTTALEFAHVACGAADVVITAGDAVWDYAAGICLIREAGGNVTDWKGNEWNNNTSYICGSNGIIHEAIVERIGPLQQPK